MLIKNRKNQLTESLGWIGVALIVSAYGLLSFHVLTSDMFMYQSMNLVGAIGIGIDAYQNKNYQPVVLQIIWGLIAIVAIVQMFT